MAYVSDTLWDADFRDDCKHFAYKELSGSRDNHVHDDKENMVPDLSDLTDEVLLLFCLALVGRLACCKEVIKKLANRKGLCEFVSKLLVQQFPC